MGATVGLQLLAVPFTAGALSLAAAVPFAVVVAVRRVAVSLTRRRLALAVGLAGWCALATFVAGRTPDASLGSLLFLLYVLVLFAFPPPLRQERVLRALFRAGVVVAALSVLQLVAQVLGFAQPNLATLLPESWLVSGYNTTPGWSFDSDLVRSNGFVCIEPSVASQYVGLALVVGATRRWLGPATIAVLLLGLAATVSGTGFIVAACALPALLRGRFRVRALATLAIVAVAAAALGLTDAIVARAENLFASTNSGGARFVLPFRIAAAVAEDLQTLLFGLGPGSALRGARAELGFADVHDSMFSTPVKLTAEYGLPAAILGVVLFVRVGVRTISPPSLAVAAILVMTLLNGGPVEPAAFVVFWLLTSARTARPASLTVPRFGAAAAR